MAFNFGGGTSGGNGFGSSAFGNSTTGGFGSTSGFGNSTQATTGGFGTSANNTSGSGFGGFGASNTASGGLFGGSKPSGFGSGSNMFGNTTTAAPSAFNAGATNAFSGSTGGGFGSGATATPSSFGSFGASSTTTTPAFGNQQNKPGGLFGQGGTGTTSTAFGSSAPAFNSAVNAGVPDCPGTAGTPFSAFTEKESNGATSAYQTITFQPPYQKYSLEELRLADYNGGRQFGNGSGTAGAFGNTNFGSGFNAGGTTNAFGNNNNNNTTTTPSLFGGGGSAAATGTGFGNNNATSTTFGNNTGSGGLFGNQNKPAGGLFGQTQSTATTSPGLFGTTNTANTTGGFGGFGNNQQSGGLFNNNNQNKPATGGLFGQNTTTGTTGGFNLGGTQNNTTTTGGLFGNAGSTTTGNSFLGGNNAQSNTGGGLFGGAQTNTGGGLFGNKTATTGFGTSTANPPSGGLFNTQTNNTGGGLFGNNQQQNQTGGSLFGAANNNQQQQQQTGGLFNQNQNKPGGLFGTGATNTGGGLFGNNNQQQQTGGLFGNNQQQAGAAQNTGLGGGLFNNQNNQNKPGGLFGTSLGNNNQNTSLFGGNNGLGQSQNNQQQSMLGQQEVKHASLLDPNPYSQSTIWTALPQPNSENAKPFFTPLTATKKLEESARKPLPNLKLNHSRYMTPPRRTGFGFSYSTYGTPSSVTSTPGGAPLSGSIYGGRGWTGGSFGRSFNRSASVQNLRSQYSESDDIWKPNAFAPSHRNSSGSIKRLTIDRSIRQDLFNRPATVPALPAPRSAGNSEPASGAPADSSTAQARRPSQKSVTFEDDSQQVRLTSETGALSRTETDDEDTPVRRNGTNGDLDPVPEERASHSTSSRPSGSGSTSDPQPGEYWMKPSRRELAKMDRAQLSSFKGFQVGRESCGFVVFDGSVDLTTVNLDEAELFDKVVEIHVRSVTVYPDTNMKPPVGRGLNVPSTITIDNSWPRSKGKPVADTSGPVFEKHITRLKRISGTEFVSYDPQTGRWVFRVPHYTRYGLDYDDADSTMDQSELSLPPHTIDKSADSSVMEVDDGSDEDTFDFKKSVPGQFGKQSIIPSDDELEYDSSPQLPAEDSGSEHSAYSEDEMMSEDEQSPSMPGSLPRTNLFRPDIAKTPTKTPFPGTPGRPLLDLEGDWAEQLQRTISPRKQNRDVLREDQSKFLLDKAFSPIKPKTVPTAKITSSLDIMNSIFKSSTRKANKAPEPDFELPYSKRSKTFQPDDSKMSDQDRVWHASFKPHFTTNGEIMYRTSKPSKDKGWKEVPVAGDKKAMVAIGRQQNAQMYDLGSALDSSRIEVVDGVPSVLHRPVVFSQLASGNDQEAVNIHNLSHVLFDDYEDEFTRGLSSSQKEKFAYRIRRDRLVKFLAGRILSVLGADLTATEQISPAKGALLRLTAHDVAGLLVAQLDGADELFMSDMKHQLDAWREQKTLSEIDYEIRALYELCAGNIGISQGREGKGIPVEDRADTFSISTRFGLSWLQCFMLGLLYGRAEKRNKDGIAKIEDAVREYQGRCDRGEEPVKPADNDVMWPLLKLYASRFDKSVSAPQFPAALEGLKKPWDHSSLFDFYNAMHATITLPTKLDVADNLAETFASELSARDDLPSAIYALSHISKPDLRKALIQDLLDRFAATLPGPDTVTSDSGIALWQRLTIDLKVPTSWIFMSKARYAASETNNDGDNISELRYLVAAESWEDAHECLLKRVAPGLVIDQDFQRLLEMCALFGAGDDPVRRASSWYNGGAVFTSFGKLMIGETVKNDVAEISSLRKRLTALGHEAGRDDREKARNVNLGQLNLRELEEHVCIKEMANALVRLSFAGADIGTPREILELPITQDVRLEILTREGMLKDANGQADSASKKPTSATRKRNPSRGHGLRGTSTAQNGDAMEEDSEPNA